MPVATETETEDQAIVVRAPATRGSVRAGFFFVTAPLDEVADGATIELPASFEHVYDGTNYGGPYFHAYDGKDSNELATNVDGASGTLVFENASCDPNPAIDVRIDATLEAERFDDRSAQVRGRATLGYED